MASDTTPYYAASVLLSRLMVSIASKMFCRGGDKNDDKEGCNDPELLKSVENLYKKATFIAAEGILIQIYSVFNVKVHIE